MENSKSSRTGKGLFYISYLGMECMNHPYFRVIDEDDEMKIDLLKWYLSTTNKAMGNICNLDFKFELDKDSNGIYFKAGEEANLRHVYFKANTNVIYTAHNFMQECIYSFTNNKLWKTRIRNFLSGIKK